MRLRFSRAVLPFLVAGVLGLTGAAASAQVTFTGTNGSNLTATATFDAIGGGLLKVTLTNTSLVDVDNPSGVLTAVFFNFGGDPLFSSDSAVLGAGSTVAFGTTDPGGVVGGEWAYGNSLSGAPGGANEGISSAGFGVFGNPTFPGSDLNSPFAVDGLNYGITSAGDDTTTGNAEVTGNVPLIQNSVVFTLDNLPGGIDNGNLASFLTKVSFQYGTALTEPNVPGGGGGGGNPVPEPGTMGMMAGMAAFGLPLLRRLRRRAR